MAGLTKAQKAAKAAAELESTATTSEKVEVTNEQTSSEASTDNQALVDFEQGAKDAAEAQKAAKAEVKLPDSVTLASPYGYDPEIEGESVRMWSAGQVVTDPKEIADLIERQAPLEAH